MPIQNLGSPHSGRLFKKVELQKSIRYASSDPIESWLNGLLCLDVASYIPNISRLSHPRECELYYVNRDTLFSYHKESEIFLQRMMALYVASHYKNSPNDLQLMSDCPSHHLFVLLGPVDESQNQLPDIFCVIQVCVEGQISRKSAIKSLSEGHFPFGDQIPWKFCEQFQDTEFPSLSGARIVRIAVHPIALRLGYGSAAVDLLIRYYQGQLSHFAEEVAEEIEDPEIRVTEAAEKILDLVPVLAFQYFLSELPLTLYPVQASVLFCIGMQNQDVTSIKEVMKLEREQILSIFIKVMKKLYNYLYSITAKEIDASLPRLMEVTMAPYSTSVDEDLDEAAEEVKEKMKADNEGFFNPELLQQYAIVDKEGEFEKALRRGAGKVSSSGLVSVKSSRSKMDTGFHKKEKRRVRWRELILKRRETDSVLFGN